MQALNEISPFNGDRPCGPAAGFFLPPAFCVWALIFLLLSHSTIDAQGDKDPPLNQRLAAEQIHYGDIVEVDVVGSLDFDWRGGLTPEGFLEGLEKVEEPVYALCRTGDQVAATLAERYRKILRDPNVVVRIIDRSNRALAYISGAVKTPQRFQLRRPVSLTEVIVLSGGITDASNGEISVFRPPYVNCRPGSSPEPSFENAATQSPKRFSIRIADLLTGTSTADIPILSGDIVSVLETFPIFVMVDSGQTRRMNLTPELTLARALTAAGGVLKELTDQKVRIFRRNSASEPIELEIRRILNSKDETPKLEPYDVIVVQKKGIKTGPQPDISLSDTSDSGKLAKLPLRIVD